MTGSDEGAEAGSKERCRCECNGSGGQLERITRKINQVREGGDDSLESWRVCTIMEAGLNWTLPKKVLNEMFGHFCYINHPCNQQRQMHI